MFFNDGTICYGIVGETTIKLRSKWMQAFGGTGYHVISMAIGYSDENLGNPGA